eukprot:SAG22_NODE_1883_length_3378_cov_3.332723_4_plen_197_part_00
MLPPVSFDLRRGVSLRFRSTRLSEMGSAVYQSSQHSPEAGGEQDSAAGADFLMSFESQALSADDIDALWNRYACPQRAGGGGGGGKVLDAAALLALLEDLSLLRSGHKNVAPEVVAAAWQTIDTDGNGEIDPAEFRGWLAAQGLQVRCPGSCRHPPPPLPPPIVLSKSLHVLFAHSVRLKHWLLLWGAAGRGPADG